MTTAHIAVVVDRSGSMARIVDEAEGGLSHFIKEQQKVDADVTISLYQFDTYYEKVYGPVPVQDVPEYKLHPRGMTALYDAIGKGIEDTATWVGSSKPDKIVMVVITDGAENSSIEHDFNSMNALIKSRKDAGWEIVFLAGSPAAVDMGRRSGLNTTEYDARKRGQTQEVYTVVAEGVSSYVGGQTTNVSMPRSVDK